MLTENEELQPKVGPYDDERLDRCRRRLAIANDEMVAELIHNKHEPADELKP